MGKKRKFNRFIRWIKSDLPEEEKSSVLLLGVTKLSSPKLQRRSAASSNNSQHKNRPHTLHFEFPTSSTTNNNTSATIGTIPTGEDHGIKQSQRRSLRDGNQINQPLAENTQNYSRKSSTPLAPSPSPSSSSSRSSVTSSKENIAPSFSSIRSSSFSGRASSPEDKPRTNSVPRNSTAGGGLLHKRVSFSDETEAIIQSRDHARRTRDLLKANSQETDEGEAAASVSGDVTDHSEINQRYIEELPSVSYYNDYAIRNECLDDLEDDDDQIVLPSAPCPECRRKSIDCIAQDEIGDILDVISNDLNIRPITRRNSSFDQTKFPGENPLEKLCEVLNEDEDDELEENSNVVHPDINKEPGTVKENDNLLDYNKNKYLETEKFYSENDIFDLFPKIVANQRRKLSTPITPAKSEDVDLFINEIIEQLDIGPRLRRDSSRRPSQSQSTTSDSIFQFVAARSSTSSTSASILPLDSSVTTTTTTTTSTTPSADDDKIGASAAIVVSEIVTPSSVNSSPESPSLNPPSNKSDSPDVVVNCLELDDQSTAAMDRSVDSIGSCSLDVDLSTDFSDSSRGSVSDCTLRSVSILTPPVIVSNGGSARDFNLTSHSKNLENNSSSNTAAISPSQNFKDEPIIKITDTDEQQTTNKKPSYLNLACCVNGYSNLTTYDSKLRESYRTGTPRSREVSPNRPGSAVVDSTSTSSYNGSSYSSQMTKPGDLNTTTTYLTPESAKYYHRITTSTSSPSKLIKSPKMTETAYSSIKQNGSTSISTKDSFFSTTRSYLSKESRNFAASMLYDSTDGCINKQTKSYLLSSPARPTYSSSTITHSISSTSQEVVNSSKTTVSTTKHYTMNGGSREYSSETSISESSSQMNRVSPSKSFIQQRVERLYGPGALAQGFFIQTRHSPRKSESENVEKTKSERNISDERERREHLENTHSPTTGIQDESLNLSNSTPSLPVLRHLRPEFRAQLPILSPKRIISENGLQKSTTVPIALKDNATPPREDRKNRSVEQLKVNGECNVVGESFDEIKESSNTTKFENGDVKEILNGTIEDSQELLLAAPTVVLPVVLSNGTDVKPVILMNGAGDTATMNGMVKSDDEIASITIDDDSSLAGQKDGHYFLKILKNETDRLVRLAERAENELETKMSELPDDALGYLRSASGKARLLVNQKMQQFEGLCHKNINQIPGEQFPTTAEDLQGFWDMVMLQITQVNDLFKDLDELRANNWIHEVKIKKSPSEKPRKPLIKKSIPTQNTANSELQRTKRDAQRKLMLEQRRKAMAAKKNKDDDKQDVEIFVPESTTNTTTSAS